MYSDGMVEYEVLGLETNREHSFRVVPFVMYDGDLMQGQPSLESDPVWIGDQTLVKASALCAREGTLLSRGKYYGYLFTSKLLLYYLDHYIIVLCSRPNFYKGHLCGTKNLRKTRDFVS